jgi:Na+/H+ antiporter NhaD/arsenite permease-like protein
MLSKDTIPNTIALQFLGVGIAILVIACIILFRRKRKSPNSRVLFKETTPKIVALQVLGWGITILAMTSVTLFWRHNYRPAILNLAVAALFTLIFFRNRKIAFAIAALSFLVVNVGLTALFHPTAVGISVTLGSILGMYTLALWGARKYPHLKRQDWKTLFDRDPESSGSPFSASSRH